MMRAKPTADWVFGLLTGVLAGLAFAMIFVEPYWIMPDSLARRYVAIGGIAGGMAVMVVRNWVASRRATANGQKNAERGAAADGGRGPGS